jgi:hypothetical protein
MSGFGEEDKVSLLGLARGGAIERFDEELQRVLDNIIDPNSSEGRREITLKVRIEPSPDGATAKVDVTCSSKLQPVHGCSTMFYIGKEKGKGVAFEHCPEQLHLDMSNSLNTVKFPGGKA